MTNECIVKNARKHPRFPYHTVDEREKNLLNKTTRRYIKYVSLYTGHVGDILSRSTESYTCEIYTNNYVTHN